MRLYHYTVGDYMLKILASGVILPATKLVPKGERPIVWFSSNPVWEPTARKGDPRTRRSFSKDETRERCHGLYRFTIDSEQTPVHAWKKLRLLSKMNPKVADGLESVAREDGANPDEWYGTFHAVERTKWTAVEKLTDAGEWVSTVMKTVI
jgi:hypothetical protein